MKKLFAGLLVLSVLFSACGSEDEKSSSAPTKQLSEDITIEFWHPFTGGIEEELTRLTEEFNSQSEFVSVELVYQGGYNDLETKLLASKQSDTLPAISVAYSTWDGLRSSFDTLNNYTDIENNNVNFADFVDSFLEEVTSENGDIYGVPFNKSTEIVYYNKDLLSQANVESNPTSFEEMFEVANTVKQETGVTGIGFDSLSGYLASSLSANGLPWEKDGEFQYANSAVVSNVELYKDAIVSGGARTAGEDNYLSGPFGSEQVAMYAGSTAGKPFVASAVDGKFEWGAMPYPNTTAVQQGTNIVIYNSSSEEEKVAAWEFINFLTTEKNVVDFALATGYIPVTKQALESDEYQTYIETDEVSMAAYNQIDNMTAGTPPSKGAGQIYREMQVTMSDILDNDKDALQSLEELSELAASLYERSE